MYLLTKVSKGMSMVDNVKQAWGATVDEKVKNFSFAVINKQILPLLIYYGKMFFLSSSFYFIRKKFSLYSFVIYLLLIVMQKQLEKCISFGENI